MHGCAVALVLLSAILHATWNAQLKGTGDRAQFMANMSVAMGTLALICAPFLPLPVPPSWGYIAVSAILHIGYNLLLLENYRKSDLSSAYPIARGISPVLVTGGAFVVMRQHPNAFMILGIAMISAGILFVSTHKVREDWSATFSALATGSIIAAYTVVDGMGVQRSRDTFSYATWVFASYLLVPVVLMAVRAPIRLAIATSLAPAMGAGVFSLAAYTLVLWATHYADVGVVSALRETSVLWAIIIGRVFLGELLNWRRLVSVFAICLGVILLVAMSR